MYLFLHDFENISLKWLLTKEGLVRDCDKLTPKPEMNDHEMNEEDFWHSVKCKCKICSCSEYFKGFFFFCQKNF